jgi:hypothetical protein
VELIEAHRALFAAAATLRLHNDGGASIDHAAFSPPPRSGASVGAVGAELGPHDQHGEGAFVYDGGLGALGFLNIGDVGWMHIPKCGSSFSEVLGHYSCPRINVAPDKVADIKFDGGGVLKSNFSGFFTTFFIRQGKQSVQLAGVGGMLGDRTNSSYGPGSQGCPPNTTWAYFKTGHGGFKRFPGGTAQSWAREGRGPVRYLTTVRSPPLRTISGYYNGLHSCQSFARERLFLGHGAAHAEFVNLTTTNGPKHKHINHPPTKAFFDKHWKWLLPRYYSCVKGLQTSMFLGMDGLTGKYVPDNPLLGLSSSSDGESPRQAAARGAAVVNATVTHPNGGGAPVSRFMRFRESFEQSTQPASSNPWLIEAIAAMESFSFVGLTDEWADSICLFHAMWGGHCDTAFEMHNVHAGAATDTTKAELTAFMESDPTILAMAKKDPDYLLFAAAEKRYRRDFAAYASADKCAVICP